VQQEMKNIKYIIYFWAVLDLLTISTFIARWIGWKSIPFVLEISDLVSRISTDPFSFFTSLVLIILELSICFSAYLLIRQNRIAAYLCYLQLPLRLLIGQSSILFINHPNLSLALRTTLVDSVELLKIATIIIWHIYVLNESTIKEALKSAWVFLTKSKNYIISLLLFEVFGIFTIYVSVCLQNGLSFSHAISWRIVPAILIGILFLIFRKAPKALAIISGLIPLIFFHSFWNFITTAGIPIKVLIFFQLINIYFIFVGFFILFKYLKTNKAHNQSFKTAR